MKFRVHHETVYTYEQSVTSCQNEAHLIPRESPRQSCLSYRIDIDPRPGRLIEREDFFGNRVIYFAIDEPHLRLSVTATSEVSVEEASQIPSDSVISWQEAVRRLQEERTAPHLDAQQYLLDSPMAGVTPDLKQYAAPSFEKGGAVASVVNDLMERIHRDFTYDPGFTTIATPLSVVLEHRRGVCQDFAHLAIACLRSHGIPSRYVSGYLETEPSLGEPKLRGADASHAWFSAYDPSCGWRDHDPTNNQVPAGRHITTAWGRDYSDVTPIKGVIYSGGRHFAQVAVDVVSLEEIS
jgi:transglutaminase-like putative cysteine protease